MNECKLIVDLFIDLMLMVVYGLNTHAFIMYSQ